MGSVAYAVTVIPGETGGWVRGSYGIDLMLSGPFTCTRRLHPDMDAAGG